MAEPISTDASTRRAAPLHHMAFNPDALAIAIALALAALIRLNIIPHIGW